MEMPQAVREQLASSMKELMRTRPVPRIRIHQVCRGSGIRPREFRSTFRSKRHFLEWVFYSEFVPRITRCQGDSGRFVHEVCAYFDENRAIYRNILTPRLARRSVRANAKRNSLIRSFNMVAPIIAKDLIEARYSDPAVRRAMTDACPALAGLFRDALFQWLQADSPMPPDAFADACLQQLDELADVSACFGATE